MEYYKTITLKDGRTCVLRNGTKDDAKAVLDVYLLTHQQTDYLLTYPDESSHTVEEEAEFLNSKTESPRAIELIAQIEGKIVGCAGIDGLGDRFKLRHRAEFGISVDKAYWGLGVGRALTEACISCAKEAGYVQLELDVVAENTAAIALYESVGFVEYGRNPLGFRSRQSGWQELVQMRLELQPAMEG